MFAQHASTYIKPRSFEFLVFYNNFVWSLMQHRSPAVAPK